MSKSNKILIITTILAVAIIGILVFVLISTQAVTPADNAVSQNSTAASASNPKKLPFVLNNGGEVMINDFIEPAQEAVDGLVVIFDEPSLGRLTYYAPSRSFLLSFNQPDNSLIASAQEKAEAKAMEVLGVSSTDICLLPLYVENSVQASVWLKLTMCD